MRYATPGKVSHSGASVKSSPSIHITSEDELVGDSAKQWTKGDWKHLDACFTEERLLASARSGAEDTLADVDDVSIGVVIDRFIASRGGADVLTSLGPQWTR